VFQVPKKPHTSLYYDEGLMDRVKMILILGKKWKNANEFIIEAIKEKLEREEKNTNGRS
jgi:hypothetical protein